MNRVCTCFLSVWLVALLFICAGCRTDLPAVQHIADKQQTTTPSAIEIVLSHSQNINTPEDIAARAMQAKLQELLGPQAEVILYADYQLGSAREQLEALQLGRVHLTIQPISAVSAFAEDLKVFDLPYLFSSNREEVIAALDGPLKQEALERIGAEYGEPAFKGLGLWFGGYKLFTFHGADFKRIHSPADFEGLTIAVPDSPLLKAQYQHWGADTVGLDAIQLYSALAQGIADGSEATAAQIVANCLYEVQHNVVQAYHSVEIYTVVANQPWFAAQPPAVQNAVIEAEAYAQTILYEALSQKEPEYVERIRQTEGLCYEVLDEKKRAIFEASVAPIYAEQLSGSRWQMDYVERLQTCFT